VSTLNDILNYYESTIHNERFMIQHIAMTAVGDPVFLPVL